MEFHRGRLIDHVQLYVADLKRARDFYAPVLETLGYTLEIDTDEAFGRDELYVSPAKGGTPKAVVHLAFQADSPEAVQRFHRVALASGGRDNGAPGIRDYHPGYYAAFVYDPDGNNIEAIHHGPATRSAASVVIKPTQHA
jgi:catechol 2,3-dioxygenase-like lactoylglutathione lyase family enzyme